jgi:hypothetical protein
VVNKCFQSLNVPLLSQKAEAFGGWLVFLVRARGIAHRTPKRKPHQNPPTTTFNNEPYMLLNSQKM